jgi:hypothetical protein
MRTSSGDAPARMFADCELYTAIDSNTTTLIAPVAKHRIGDDVAVESLLRIRHPDQREALGPLNGKRCA